MINCVHHATTTVYHSRTFYSGHIAYRALHAVSEKGEPGRTYNVGGDNEKQNLEVVKTVCIILDRLSQRADGRQITYVADRPGTTSAMRTTRPGSRTSLAGSPPRRSRPASRRPSPGISTTRTGGRRSSPSIRQNSVAGFKYETDPRHPRERPARHRAQALSLARRLGGDGDRHRRAQPSLYRDDRCDGH